MLLELARPCWRLTKLGGAAVTTPSSSVQQRRYSGSAPTDRFSSGTSVNVHEHKLVRPVRKPKLTDEGKKALLEETSKGSLIPTTLEEMSKDADFVRTAADLKKFGQKALTKQERLKRQRALDKWDFPSFEQMCAETAATATAIGEDFSVARRDRTETLQLNIGLYCNQACSHCHVESSPKRRAEVMDARTAERCVHLLGEDDGIKTVDITGGAPELCEQFRFVSSAAAGMGKEVIDRCNLTSLLEPAFLSEDRRV